MKQQIKGSKGKMKIVILISILILVLIAVALIIALPRKGAESNEVWTNTEGSFNIDSFVSLDKTENEDFVILQLSDLQYSGKYPLPEHDSGISRSKLYDDLIAKIDKAVKETNPDLIILPGDQVWEYFNDVYMKKIGKVIDSYGIAWAPVFGNHDDEGRADKNKLGDIMENDFEHCLFKKGPKNITGVGNYILNIKENDKILYSVIMLDCGDVKTVNKIPGKYVYPYLDYNQIEWAKWNMENISSHEGNKVPSLLVTHQAPYTLRQYYDERNGENFEAGNESGIVEVPENMGFGKFMEAPGAYADMAGYNNTHWENTAAQFGTTHIILSHDHINDAVIKLDGMWYCYGRKVGKYSYSNEEMQGYTTYSINSSREVKVEHHTF